VFSSQTITFTSNPPTPAVVGGTYTPTATGGGSGNFVSFSVDRTTTSVCWEDLYTGMVHFTHVGTCTIDANQPAGPVGSGGYLYFAAAQQQ
jgi:hypothetical protein